MINASLLGYPRATSLADRTKASYPADKHKMDRPQLTSTQWTVGLSGNAAVANFTLAVSNGQTVEFSANMAELTRLYESLESVQQQIDALQQ